LHAVGLTAISKQLTSRTKHRNEHHCGCRGPRADASEERRGPKVHGPRERFSWPPPGGSYGASRPEKDHPFPPFHRGRRGSADQCDAATHGEDAAYPLGNSPIRSAIPKEVFDCLQAQLATNRSQFYRDVPAEPFYGYNRLARRPSRLSSQIGGARVAGSKAHYDGIVAFSPNGLHRGSQEGQRPRSW
jgi:hypothetical protein